MSGGYPWGELLLRLRYFRNARPGISLAPRGELLLLGLPYLRNHSRRSYKLLSGELLLDLQYFRNSVTPVISAAIGELLLGLRYFRNEWNAPRLSVKVNYYLDYGTSKT